MGPGIEFGVTALINESFRNSTVISRGEGELWTLDKESFDLILKQASIRKRNEYHKFLDNIPLFASLRVSERDKIADALKEKTYEEGEFIFKQVLVPKY